MLRRQHSAPIRTLILDSKLSTLPLELSGPAEVQL